jgi:hypothetical protein
VEHIMTNELTLAMLDSIEIRPAKNGFIITTRSEDGEDEHVFDSHLKAIKFIKKAVTPE